MFFYVRGAEGLGPEERHLLQQAAEAAQRMDDAEAERCYRLWRERAPFDPRPAYGLSLTLLRQNRYEEGFALYEARCWIAEAGVPKPDYSERRPFLIPREILEGPWGQQTILLRHPDEDDRDAPVAASA